jgi:hypothetical protein
MKSFSSSFELFHNNSKNTPTPGNVTSSPSVIDDSIEALISSIDASLN